MGYLKRWNGSQWVESGAGSYFKKWNGSSWVNATVKRWSGSFWETISQQQYTSEYVVTWSRAYGGNNNYKGDNIKGSRNELFQGRYGEPDTYVQGDWGIQKSMAGFDDAKIRSDLSGASIQKIELYIENWHWWYFAGGRMSLGIHNQSNPPSTFSETRYSIVTSDWSQRGGGKWITLPNYVAEELRDGKARGFTLHRATTDLYYYGRFYGAGRGSSTPKLRITYTK